MLAPTFGSGNMSAGPESLADFPQLQCCYSFIFKCSNFEGKYIRIRLSLRIFDLQNGLQCLTIDHAGAYLS